MIIIGAGLAGLLAGKVLIKDHPIIIERQNELPHNHEAVLRFRTPAISEATGIAFKEVVVRKSLFSNGQFLDKPNVYVANKYALKVSGGVNDRSIWDIFETLRYIAPASLVKLLAFESDIRFNTKFDLNYPFKGTPVISTMPMPILMDLVKWPNKPDFKYQAIWTLNFEIVSPMTNVHQTIYFPDHDVAYYRATLTGRNLIIEYAAEPDDSEEDMKNVAECFGILYDGFKCIGSGIPKKHPYGKIIPIDEDVRQEFIYTMSSEYGIYSLGRFATWRQILLDDLLKDIGIIRSFISSERSRKSYRQALSTVSVDRSTTRQ